MGPYCKAFSIIMSLTIAFISCVHNHFLCRREESRASLFVQHSISYYWYFAPVSQEMTILFSWKHEWKHCLMCRSLCHILTIHTSLICIFGWKQHVSHAEIKSDLEVMPNVCVCVFPQQSKICSDVESPVQARRKPAPALNTVRLRFSCLREQRVFAIIFI